MAYGKRKSYKKRPSYRRKRVAYRRKRATKRAGYRLSKGLAPNRSLTVRLRYEDSVVITSTVIQTNTSFNFKLSSCTNFTVYATAFDSYKVSKVCFKIIPPITQFTDTTATGPIFPLLARPYIVSALDWDSPGQTLTSVEETEHYANSRQTELNKVHTRTWTPRMYNVIRRSSISNTYIPAKLGLMDNATADTELAPTLCIAWPLTYEPVTCRIEVSCIATFYGNRAS